jgi:hypothetical protein
VILADASGAPSTGTTVTGTAANGAPATGNPVRVGGVFNVTEPTYGNGQIGDLQIGLRGSLQVQLMAPDSVNPLNTTGSGTLQTVQMGDPNLGGASARVLSAASTNATSTKAATGTLFDVELVNTNAAARYFKFYNKASAPVVGTDIPVLTIALPPNVPVNFQFPIGKLFATGIAWAITTGVADSDTGAVGAGDVTGAFTYV